MVSIFRSRSFRQLRQLDDLALLERYHRGNDTAIGVLFDRYYEELFHLSHIVLIDKVYACEVVSLVLEAYLKTPRKDRKRKFAIHTNARNFLRRSVVRRSIDMNRKKVHSIHRIGLSSRDSHAEAPMEELLRNTLTLSKLSEYEGREVLNHILAQLEGKEQAVFQLFAEGYSHKEICKLLNMTSTRNVSSALYNARKKAQALYMR